MVQILLDYFYSQIHPPERDLEWTATGVEGIFKFLNRLISSCSSFNQYVTSSHYSSQTEHECLKLIHQTIYHVTDDYEKFHFNKSIARIRELNNHLALGKASNATYKLGLNTVLQLLNPFAPHVTEELWQMLGNEELLVECIWPVANKDYLVNDRVNIAVQINGKLKSVIELPLNSLQDVVLGFAKEIPNVATVISDKEITKVIYVPNKIMNILCK